MSDSVFHPDHLREDIDTEFKRAGGKDGRGAVPQDMFETYSAFANTDGGSILLGVTEVKGGKLIVTGIDDPDRVMTDLWNQFNNPQKVSRNLLSKDDVVRHSTEEGRWVLEIRVPRATRQERPVYIGGNPLNGTYKRIHAADYRCSEDEVKRMLAEQTEDARDARLLENFTFDDLDLESFRAYRSRFAGLKPDHPFNNSDAGEFLRQIGGWKRDRNSGNEGLTAAGLLMFGRHEAILEAFPNYFVDYRELPVSRSKTKWVDRLIPDGTWSGNLYDFYRQTIQRLFRDLKVPFRLEGGEREDDTPVHKALREALVNALVHADYSARISILIVKAPDYFGFRNPGKMRIPIDKALEGGHSDSRNRHLQKMFTLIGLGEQAGSGIPRVIENWKTQHYRAPELWESDDPEATLMRLRTVSLLPEETLRELEVLFGEEFERLDEDGRMALATAHIEGFVTNRRLQHITRLHPRDITALLKNLVEGGFLVPDGQGRATTYHLAGLAPVDLADGTDLGTGEGSVEHSMARSEGLKGTSEGLQSRSEGLAGTSEGLESEDPATNAQLLAIADPIRRTGKAPKPLVRETIQRLCRNRFLHLNQLANLLNRSPVDLRQRYVKPMVEEGLLDRRYPQQPNHEQQAYRTHEQ